MKDIDSERGAPSCYDYEIPVLGFSINHFDWGLMNCNRPGPEVAFF